MFELSCDVIRYPATRRNPKGYAQLVVQDVDEVEVEGPVDLTVMVGETPVVFPFLDRSAHSLQGWTKHFPKSAQEAILGLEPEVDEVVLRVEKVEPHVRRRSGGKSVTL